MTKIHIHIIVSALVALVSLIVFAGCRKAPINGKLDGQWQIMNIELIDDGSDVTPSVRSYINLNLHVVDLRNLDNNRVGGNLIYDKEASRITLDFPYNTGGEELLQLRNWGFYENPVTLDILKLDGSQLILRSPETIITCRRF